MNNIGGNNDSILISEIKEFKKPSILASLFMVFEVMFEISIPFVMASLLDQGVQQRNMNNIFFLRWAHAGLCLSLPLLWDAVCRYGAYASAGFAKTFVGHFQKRFKPSHLRILISSHQVG